MKQVITFNTTMEALILENKPLALGCQKKIMIIGLFCHKPCVNSYCIPNPKVLFNSKCISVLFHILP